MIKWNTCHYYDCMDKEQGLPSLPDKSIELGYTDYPWGSDMKPNVREYHNRILDNDNNKVFFDDTLDAFSQEFTLAWFYELERVCHKIILVIPEAHKKFWWRNTDPTNDIPVLWKNGFSGSKVANNYKQAKREYQEYILTNENARQDFEDLFSQFRFQKIFCLICYCKAEKPKAHKIGECHRFWLIELLKKRKRMMLN